MPAAVDFHDAMAPGWDRRYQHGGFARRRRFFERLILPRLRPSGLWLDVGCGSGTFARALAREARTVVGVDASPQMLHEAQSYADGNYPQLSFSLIRSAEELPFPAMVFDGALCLSVLEYLVDPDRALAELARVLKPGGVLVVSVPNRRSLVRAVEGWCTRLMPNGRFGYMALSRHVSEPCEIESRLHGLDFESRVTLGFDPFIPRVLHPILSASLIYVIAEKRQREAP